MQCNQLISLVKDWYTHVKNETMAPARMMQFVDKHVNECTTCQQDPDLSEEIDKIREYVLPESKLPKPFRTSTSALTPEISPSEVDMNKEEEDEENEEDEKDEPRS